MDEKELSEVVGEEPEASAEATEEETPEPTPEELKAQLAELKQLHEGHAAELERIQGEATKRERAVQSAKDIEIAQARREAEEVVRTQVEFDNLLALMQAGEQGDIDAGDKFQKAMRDPAKVAVWNWGLEAQRPTAVNQAVAEAQLRQLTQIQASLEASDIIGKLGAEKMAEIRQATPRDERMPGYIIRLAEAAAEVLAQKMVDEKLSEHEQAVTSKVLANEHKKAGDVAELKGGGSGGTLTPASYKAMSEEERRSLPPEQIDAMTRTYLQ